MAKVYTLEELRSWTPERRHQLYMNARDKPEGKYIIELIDKNSLSLSSGALTLDSPLYLQILDLVWSEEGKKAAFAATDQGLPALCGVDALLTAKLGTLYGKHDLGTANAGSAIAELMRHHGYEKIGEGRCPERCTAKSGAIWRARGKASN